MSVKEQVLQAINRLPDDIDFRDVTEEIAFLAAVREAGRDIQTVASSLTSKRTLVSVGGSTADRGGVRFKRFAVAATASPC